MSYGNFKEAIKGTVGNKVEIKIEIVSEYASRDLFSVRSQHGTYNNFCNISSLIPAI